MYSILYSFYVCWWFEPHDCVSVLWGKSHRFLIMYPWLACFVVEKTAECESLSASK